MDLHAEERDRSLLPLLAQRLATGLRPKFVYTVPRFHNPTGSTLSSSRYDRLLELAVHPAAHPMRPIGEWNRYEILVQGPRVATRLNDVQLYDVDTREVSVPEGKKPFAERAPKGFLGLQRHAPEGVEGDAYAWFRNAFVREL